MSTVPEEKQTAIVRDVLARCRQALMAHLAVLLDSHCHRGGDGTPIRDTLDPKLEEEVDDLETLVADIDFLLESNATENGAARNFPTKRFDSVFTIPLALFLLFLAALALFTTPAFAAPAPQLPHPPACGVGHCAGDGAAAKPKPKRPHEGDV